jgi:hypothetical protein
VLIVSLYRSLGFRAVRIQVGKCCSLFRSEWKRVRSEPVPSFPRKLFYISRIATPTVPLLQWIAGQQRKSSDLVKEAVHLERYPKLVRSRLRKIVPFMEGPGADESIGCSRARMGTLRRRAIIVRCAHSR